MRDIRDEVDGRRMRCEERFLSGPWCCQWARLLNVVLRRMRDARCQGFDGVSRAARVGWTGVRDGGVRAGFGGWRAGGERAG